MTKSRIAFQGEIGAYSEQTAVRYFGAHIDLYPVPNFKSLFNAVQKGEADAAIVPIENALAGSVHENYDLLLQHKLPITGEVYLKIAHHLLALPSVKKSDIRRVISHPQALQQCRAFLDRWDGVEIVPAYDTAGSAKTVREQNLHDTAAIASEQAAREYDLDILASDIATNHENYTRFLILEKDARPPANGGKTSIVFAMKEVPGALFKSLAVFARRDINLLKIESRPLHGKPFDYFFYLDFEGSIREQATQKALEHLEEITTFLQVLGSYNKGKMQ
ncbi:MAG: prephenate dehydratase [bacterium]